MSRLFTRGDRVIRVPGLYGGNYVGEVATVVEDQKDNANVVHILFDNKEIGGVLPYRSHESCIELFTPGDDYGIDYV